MLRNEKVIRSLLSNEMLEDVKDYEKTGEDAIFWLATKKGKSYKDIITRLQSSEIDMVSNSGLKTEEEWTQLFKTFGEVNPELIPVDENEEKGKLYSCYALKGTINRTSKLMYPLVDSHATRYDLFSNKNDCPNYQYMLQKIKNAYNVKINDNSTIRNVDYKPRFKVFAKIKSAGYKVLNLCRKYLKKEEIFEPLSFKGKISVESEKLSNAEKLTGILNAINERKVKHINKTNKLNLNDREQYAAAIYSDILMSRVLNYGNNQLNEKIELSLRLQFSNLLARDCFGVETLEKIADVGIECALFNLEKLGITTKDATINAKNAGYEFAKEPTSIKEAMLGHKVNEYKDELLDDKTTEKFKEKVSKKKDIKSESKKEAPKKEEESPTLKKKETPKKEKTPEKPKESDDDYKSILTEKIKNEDPQKFEVSVRKQFDKVMDKVFKEYAKKTKLLMDGKENKNCKVYKKYERRHEFAEKMACFYENNKKVDANGVVENFNALENNMSKDDVLIARNYANALINLREAIIESLTEDGKLKNIYKNATSNKAINYYIAEKFKKSKLSTYLSSVLDKSLKDIDKLSSSTIEC